MPEINYVIPENLLYDTNDFWIKIIGEEAVVGMTDYGQSNTGDILYLELFPAGEAFRQGEKFGSIESGKWVGNLTAPLSGTILDSNQEVELNPRKVNADAYGEGWIYKIKISNPEEVAALMPYQRYARWVAEQIENEEEKG
ncbi:MAG: glycine cleavage system protein GcvH [Syntrophomonadaceae bacterium]|nr:glycine cleavage system protein GcvH [Syntrophomonadaceae bacterium]